MFGELRVYPVINSSYLYPFAFTVQNTDASTATPGIKYCYQTVSSLPNLHYLNLSISLFGHCSAIDNANEYLTIPTCYPEFLTTTYFANSWSIGLFFTILVTFATLAVTEEILIEKRRQSIIPVPIYCFHPGILIYSLWACFSFYPDTDALVSMPIFLFVLFLLLGLSVVTMYACLVSPNELPLENKHLDIQAEKQFMEMRERNALKAAEVIIESEDERKKRLDKEEEKYQQELAKLNLTLMTPMALAITVESFLAYSPLVDANLLLLKKEPFEIKTILFMSHKWPDKQRDSPNYDQLKEMQNYVRSVEWKGGIWLDWMMPESHTVVQLVVLLANSEQTPEIYACKAYSAGYLNSLWCRLEYALHDKISNEKITHLEVTEDWTAINEIVQGIRVKKTKAIVEFYNEMKRFENRKIYGDMYENYDD